MKTEIENHISITRVVSKSDWNEFDPCGRPKTLDPNLNSFFRHAYMYPIIAKKDGKRVGRAVAFIDEDFNRRHRVSVCKFGFLDFINDREVVACLFGAISDWAKLRGVAELRGPENPSEEFNGPVLDVNFKLLEEFGFKKYHDIFDYSLKKGLRGLGFDESITADAEKVRQTASIKFRQPVSKMFDRGFSIVLEVTGEVAGIAFIVRDRRILARNARIVKVDIKKDYLLHGLTDLFYLELFRRIGALGYRNIEVCGIEEGDKELNAFLSAVCGEPSKTYRIYNYTIAA